MSYNHQYDPFLLHHFGEFGQAMFMSLICGFIPYVGGILSIYFAFKGYENIQAVNSRLNDRHLHEYVENYKKYWIIVGVIVVYAIIYVTAVFSLAMKIEQTGFISGVVVLTVVFIILAIYAIIMTIRMYENLYLFFRENPHIVPPPYNQDAMDGDRKSVV